MGRIPEQIIEKVRDASDIVAIVEKLGVSLKKQGVNHWGICPFHDDRHASLCVSQSKQIFTCFSCGKTGNVFSFVMEREGMTYPEAVRWLGKEAGIDVPAEELTPEQQQANDERESVRIVVDAAQSLLEGQLLCNEKARQYVLKRGISDDSIKLFGIGFAPGQGFLCKTLAERGYKEEYLLMGDIIRKKEGRTHDTFQQRITFPYYDRRGRIVGWTGRAIAENPAVKYLNTGDTAIFQKGNQIFGLWQARQAISKAGFAYVCEGQMDVVSMAQRGVRNIVAGSGTAFTEQQRKLLKGLTRKLVMLYDGDAAGANAALKHIRSCVEAGFDVRCVFLSGGVDPDDLARKIGDEIGKWLTEHTISYIEYLCKTRFDRANDAHTQAESVREILGIVVLELPEVRERMLLELAIRTETKVETLNSMLDKVEVPTRPDDFQPGFHGLDFVEDFMDVDNREAHLTTDWNEFQRRIGQKQPWVLLSGFPAAEDMQGIHTKVKRIVVHKAKLEADATSENSTLEVLKELFRKGMVVDVATEHGTRGFIYAYVQLYGDMIDKLAPTPEVRSRYLNRSAEMISFCSSSVQTTSMRDWAEMLHLKLGELKAIVKPFNDERRASGRIERERGDLGTALLDFSPEKIPGYVEESEEYSAMLRRYNYFPLLSRQSKEPVCYMFRDANGQLRRVADFYMEPLFHVYSRDGERNRRVIRLTSLYTGGSKYVELPSKAFAKLSSLDERLIEEGAYNFENGTAADYGRIRASMSYRFPVVEEINVYGQQPEGCFLFANAILHEVDGVWRIDYADQLGLMRHDSITFYSPAFSKVNVGIRQDNDDLDQLRQLTYHEVPAEKRITFQRWTALMDEVYKVNDNGKFAVIYAIMCAFRSDIYRRMNRIFTSLFFVGPTMSGKTQIAISIRSLFIKPEVPAFNLNSGTDAAFFSVLEKFRDVPQIMEEYNDEQISDIKFQGLKSVTYDGDGKQKRKAATGNDIETSKVNAPVILLGQEAPQKDDGALANRVVLCEVPKREDINEDHARQIFETLKQSEQDGLSYLLVDILKLRPLVQQHFQDLHRRCVREIQEKVENSGRRSGDQTRIINTVAMFAATARLLVEYAPHLRLPFTYEQFLSLCVEKVTAQIGMIQATNKLAEFFDIVEVLVDHKTLIPGRDYRILQPGRGQTLARKKQQPYVVPTDQTRILYLRIESIHAAYMAEMQRRAGHEHPLTKQTLFTNLRSDPTFIGETSGFKFRWEEEVASVSPHRQEGDTPFSTRLMQSFEKVTSAVILNYTLFGEHYEKDLERNVASKT